MDEQNTQNAMEATGAETEMPSANAEDATVMDAPDVEVPAGDVMAVDPVMTADAAIQTKAQTMELLQGLGQDVIYMMGLSFILGSLFTVFVLLVLDFMRRNSNDAK